MADKQWVLVPKEPTEDMLNAGWPTGRGGYRNYVAMIAAAPPPLEGWRSIGEIAAERRRQIEVEGFTPQHDDDHDNGELARAAACYAAGEIPCAIPAHGSRFVPIWPWDRRCFKPGLRRRSLVKAAALIVAEIERLDRGRLALAETAPRP